MLFFASHRAAFVVRRAMPLGIGAALLACAHVANVCAVEDIEFVAEHLAEVPMDNRYATLPIWRSTAELARPWSYSAQVGVSSTSSGNLNNAGPLFSVAVTRVLTSRWDTGAVIFADTTELSGDADERPLQTDFSPDTPLPLPVAARFDDLDGRMRHYGGGPYVALSANTRWLGEQRWVGGLLWQQVELRDYRLTYHVLEGPALGVSGQIAFDADYKYVTPFVGLELPRRWTRWSVSPHVLAAWPFSKRSVVGHITGPGFDLHGDTESAGEGTHIGDPSLTMGFDVTYLPAHLSIDVGALVMQYLIEPYVNKGIETNWVLSCQWRF
jgi:hypothetical protein